MEPPLAEYFDQLPLKQRNIAYQARQVLLSLDNSVKEIIRYNIPFYCYKSKNIFYLSYHNKKELVLGVIYGAYLQNESNILEGEQKLVRHIPLEKVNIQSEECLSILQQAILYVEQKFFSA